MLVPPVHCPCGTEPSVGLTYQLRWGNCLTTEGALSKSFLEIYGPRAGLRVGEQREEDCSGKVLNTKSA